MTGQSEQDVNGVEQPGFAVPYGELRSVRCAVCRNCILFLEDLHVLDGLPVCPQHANARYAAELHARTGGSVVLVG